MNRLLVLAPAVCWCALLGGSVATAQTITSPGDFTWNGGSAGTGTGDGVSFSDNGNWDAEILIDFGSGSVLTPAPQAPNFDVPTTGHSLIFGTAGQTINNDLDPDDNGGTPLTVGLGVAGNAVDSAGFHFLDGAGDFTFTGFGITNESNAIIRLDGATPTTQTFDMPVAIHNTASNTAVQINTDNASTIVFNGEVNFANDRLFLNGVDGARLVLNAANTGLGLGAYGGGTTSNTTNGGRSVFRNNLGVNVLELNNNLALGDPGTGTWDAGDLQTRSVAGNSPIVVESSVDGVDLSGYSFVSAGGAGAGNIQFSNSLDMTVGYLERAGNGGRNISSNGDGDVYVAGGIFLSESDQGRDMGLFPSGNGAFIIDGRLFNTIIDPISATGGGALATGIDNSSRGGIAIDKQITANNGADINAALGIRNGVVRLNGDSSSSWIGGQVEIRNNATVVVGNDNAFGDITSLISVEDAGGDGTLDLNGHTIPQNFSNVDGIVINSDTVNAAEFTGEMLDVGNPTFDGPGDIIAGNIRRTNGVTRRTFKQGAGTLTLGGNLNNNRYGLTVDGGAVVLDKVNDDGFSAIAVARFDTTINNGSTVTIGNGVESALGSGRNNQLDDIAAVIINDGTLDLGGNQEAIGGFSGGSSGVVTSTGAGLFHGNTEAVLFIGEAVQTAREEFGATFPSPVPGTGEAIWVWDGSIQDGDHVVGVSVNGGVRQVFNDTNSYTGSTTVASSVVSDISENTPSTNLLVAGSITGTSSVTVEEGAILSGIGSIASPVWSIAGTLQPGQFVQATSESLTLDYSSGTDFSIESTATLSFVLDASTSSSIDLIGSATGDVTIDGGTFDFTDLTGGSLVDGTVYTLIDGDSNATYNFTNNPLITGLTGFGGSSIAVVGNDVVLNLVAGPDPLLGDFNGDGMVDTADYTVFRDNFGLSDAALNGNGTNDISGTVVIGDYLLWKDSFGNTAGGGGSVAAIPEPAALVLLVAGLAVCPRRRV